MTEELSSWRDGPSQTGNHRFRMAEHVARADRTAVPPGEERVAVFDNDGTLWVEKPIPIQTDFILAASPEMVTTQPDLRERQPWKAGSEGDVSWFGSVIAEHYAGDETQVNDSLAGIMAAYAGISVEDFEEPPDAVPPRRAASDARAGPIWSARTRRWSSCSTT